MKFFPQHLMHAIFLKTFWCIIIFQQPFLLIILLCTLYHRQCISTPHHICNAFQHPLAYAMLLSNPRICSGSVPVVYAIFSVPAHICNVFSTPWYMLFSTLPFIQYFSTPSHVWYVFQYALIYVMIFNNRHICNDFQHTPCIQYFSAPLDICFSSSPRLYNTF